MNEPVRILQWGMGPNLGGVDCLMMDIYRHIDRSKVQFDFLCDHDADKLAFEDEILALGGRVFRVMVSQHESMMKSRTALMSFSETILNTRHSRKREFPIRASS